VVTHVRRTAREDRPGRPGRGKGQGRSRAVAHLRAAISELEDGDARFVEELRYIIDAIEETSTDADGSEPVGAPARNPGGSAS
jgi:hypothetical protein